MPTSSVSVKVVNWLGSPSIEKATGLKKELVDAFSKAGQVVVSLSALETIDLSGIQLLLAARKEAEAKGKIFRLTGTVKPELARAFSVSGFSRPDSASAQELEADLFGRRPNQDKEPS